MQRCNYCGKDIRFVATGPQTSVACDSERKLFVTESGRKAYGYLVHECEKTEGENAKKDEK